MSAVLSVSAGYDVKYLTDAVRQGREGYYADAVTDGEPPGIWFGAGAAELGLSGEVDADLLEAIYTHGLDPRDPAAHDRSTWGEAARFGSSPRAYKTPDEIYDALVAANPDAGPEDREQFRVQAEQSARTPVSFIDVTFNASKSITLLALSFEVLERQARAARDNAAAERWATEKRFVEDAVLAGARASLGYMQDNAGVSRVGKHGAGAGRWIDAHKLVGALFLQHDSRDGDPQLHVHGPVLNRVMCSDGKVRTLDGAGFFSTFKAAASALGGRVTDTLLESRYGGVSCEVRADGKAREIVGVDTTVMEHFSKRTHAIEPKADELVAQFRETNGRPPTAVELYGLRQRATLATRPAKSHDGVPREVQVAGWNESVADILPGGLGSIALAVMDRAPDPAARWSERDVIERALDAVGQKKGAWTPSDLMRCIDDVLPGRLGIPVGDIQALLEGLTETALKGKGAERIRRAAPTTNLPAHALLAGGLSPFAAPGRELYATPGQVAAERCLREAAVERGAVALTEAQAAAVLARFTEAGRELGADQAAAVRGVLTSGAVIEVISAGAGTGKSFVLGALAQGWTGTGERRVFGLAPSQIAAGVLGEEGLDATNTTRWLLTQDRLARPGPGGGLVEDERWRLRRGDLVVLDEAGMTSTQHIARIRERCAAVGAKLLLVGDPRQLGAVGPGGAMAEVAEHGITYELTEVRRFRAEWEREASLRLREGDPGALDAYERHGRLVEGGTVEQAETAAARAWLGDTLAGREAVLLVDSNDQAARVSANLRDELVNLGRVETSGVALKARGTVAGVGDLVQTRENAFGLVAGSGHPVTNRDVWTVVARDGTGALRVRLNGTEGTEVTLPASYVREHVALAYASTVHAAQGRTVDTSHAVLAAISNAAAAYVALTRGKDSNIAYTVTRALAADAATGETFDARSRTPRAVLADVLAAAQQEESALAQRRQAELAAASTETHVGQLLCEIEELTPRRTAAMLDRLATTEVITPEQRAALAADNSLWSLERLLRTVEVAGHDPAAVLDAAAGARGLDDAAHPAEVLHWRISHQLRGQLSPRVTDAADLVPRDLPREWQQWFDDRAADVDSRRRELGVQTAVEAPGWATEALGPVPDDEAARVEWEAKAGTAAAYREMTGHTSEEDPLGAAPAAGRVEHAALFRAAHEALGLIDLGAEEADMSDGRLRNRVAAVQRERAAAPPDVGHQLDTAHQQLQRHRADAAIWGARAEVADNPAEAERLRSDAAAAEREAAELAERTEKLELADQAHTGWLADTVVVRDLGERSLGELRARGVDPEDRSDHVTAQEWLDAHRDAQTEDDQRRHVDEREVDDQIEEATAEHDDGLDQGDEPTTPRPAEPVDVPQPRRSAQPPDETAALVTRAGEAVAEIEARRQADDARAAADAADTARQSELARWAADDRAAQQAAEDALVQETAW